MSKKNKVTATQEWQNDWPDNRPAIWFKLFRQVKGSEKLEEVPNVCIKPLASWTTNVEWMNIEAQSPEGIDYIFSVQEVDFEGDNFTPTGYTKIEKGLSVINIYQPNRKKVFISEN